MTEDSLKPTCPACGAEVAPDAHFCSACGAAIPAARTCPKCGAALEEGARICLECGTDVAPPSPPRPTAYATPPGPAGYAPAPPEERSSDTTLIVLFVAVALLVLCCCCLFVFLRSGIVQAFMEGFRRSLRFGCLPLHLA